MKVCTIVVTYNRYELLKECLDSLLKQSYHTDILVINNASTDDTHKKIKEDGYLEHRNLIYKELENNLGGAGGFHYGINYSQENDYNFTWLMDDDAEPKLDALELLMKNIDEKYSAYASKVFIGDSQNYKLSLSGHRGVFDYYNPLPSFQKPLNPNPYANKSAEIEMASFVGILIPITSVRKIGLPEKKFFIHHDDTEYSLRLITLGKILMINDSHIYHKEERKQEKIERQFLWFKKNRVKFDRLWLKYFGLRNAIFLTIKYGKGYKRYFFSLKLYFDLVKDIILYDDKKWIRLVFATNSFIDGIRGHFDNEKPTRILKDK